MLKKEDLENLEKLELEKENLKERSQKLKSKPQKILADGVKGSSKNFPYTQHIIKVEGLDDSITYRKRKNTIKKYEKMIQQKQRKIEKEILRIEYELNYIEEADIRVIIRLKYFEKLNWIQVMHRMHYNSESTAKVKLKRFFEKNNKM